jgi:hypothetical protein
MDAFDHDRYRGSDLREVYARRCNRFSFAVPVGVVHIWRFDRNLQTEKDDETVENVSPGLQASATNAKERPTIPAEIFRTTAQDLPQFRER